MTAKLGLRHHKHSGKLIEHHHTSYPALAFLLLISAVLSAAVSFTSQAANSTLSLTVLGAPPSIAATIDEPADLERFAVNSTTVRGTCPLGVLVEIYRNGIFAGSTLCDNAGLYNLVITLVPDQNDLVARVSDGLGQYGPDSATVTVYYDVPPPTPTPTPPPTPSVSPGPTPGTGSPTPKPSVKPTPKPGASPSVPPAEAFYITSGAHYFQGAGPSVPVEWALQIHGGKTPYTITWNWGDGQEDTTTSTSSSITNSHQYSAPGNYRVVVRAREAGGREAVITLLAIVNGSPASGTTRPFELPGNLIFIWPTLILASLLVLSFWLGERHKLAVAGADPVPQ